MWNMIKQQYTSVTGFKEEIEKQKKYEKEKTSGLEFPKTDKKKNQNIPEALKITAWLNAT